MQEEAEQLHLKPPPHGVIQVKLAGLEFPLD